MITASWGLYGEGSEGDYGFSSENLEQSSANLLGAQSDVDAAWAYQRERDRLHLEQLEEERRRAAEAKEMQRAHDEALKKQNDEKARALMVSQALSQAETRPGDSVEDRERARLASAALVRARFPSGTVTSKRIVDKPSRAPTRKKSSMKASDFRSNTNTVERAARAPIRKKSGFIGDQIPLSSSDQLETRSDHIGTSEVTRNAPARSKSSGGRQLLAKASMRRRTSDATKSFSRRASIDNNVGTKGEKSAESQASEGAEVVGKTPLTKKRSGHLRSGGRRASIDNSRLSDHPENNSRSAEGAENVSKTPLTKKRSGNLRAAGRRASMDNSGLPGSPESDSRHADGSRRRVGRNASRRSSALATTGRKMTDSPTQATHAEQPSEVTDTTNIDCPRRKVGRKTSRRSSALATTKVTVPEDSPTHEYAVQQPSENDRRVKKHNSLPVLKKKPSRGSLDNPSRKTSRSKSSDSINISSTISSDDIKCGDVIPPKSPPRILEDELIDTDTSMNFDIVFGDPTEKTFVPPSILEVSGACNGGADFEASAFEFGHTPQSGPIGKTIGKVFGKVMSGVGRP